MHNRLQIDPLNMSPEEESILANYLQGITSECRISHRHRHFRVGKPVFWLSHDIVVRQKAPGIWRYYVVDLNEVGSGRYGAVFKLIGRLHFDPFNRGHLVVKHYAEYSRVYKKQKYLAESEYRNMQHFPHLQTREYLSGYPNFISMRHFNGSDLFKIIENDFNGVEVLSLDARYQLSISLLRSLQDQVFDWMMLHRDIKPNNIIYNPVTHEVFIIDMGNSMEIGRYLDKRSNGNSRYSAPEVFTSKEHGRPITMHEYLAHAPTVNMSTIKSDIYSMALVISLIWRNHNSLLFGDCGGAKRRVQIRAYNKWHNEMSLFVGIENQVAEHARPIAMQLSVMTDVCPERRPDLQQCIAHFESLYLEYKLTGDVGNKKAFSHANELGLACYAEMRRIKRAEALFRAITPIIEDIEFPQTGSLRDFLDKLGKKYLYKYSTLYRQLKLYTEDYQIPLDAIIKDVSRHLYDMGTDLSLHASIRSFAARVVDNPSCIAEFICVSGMQCLKGIETRDDLMVAIKDVFTDFTHNYLQVTVGYANVLAMLKQAKQGQDPDEDRTNLLSMFANDLGYFFKSIRNKPMTIDWLYSIGQHCARKHAKLTNAFQELATQQEDNVANQYNV